MTHVLIVDDDSDIRETLGLLLTTRSHQVDQAENGLVALEFLAKATTLPELILLDMTMPVMSGAEFLKAVSLDARCLGIPIIIMSANLDLLQNQRRTCLAKPFNVEQLYRLLDSWPKRKVVDGVPLR